MKFSLPSKEQIASKKVLVPALVTVLAAGTVAGTTVLNATPTSATETSPLEQQVDQQGQELQNHESRITNAENNINGLQKNTGTATPTTSSSQATETTSTSSTNTTGPTPAPVTAVSYKQIPLDSNGNIDCQLTYSDGTTYQWHWQTVNPQGSWVTDGQGQNGHWQSSTSNVNSCDSSVIGSAKS